MKNVLCLSILVAACVASDLAVAAEPGAALEITVNYGELDLAKDEGAARLYSRLRAAARKVCAPFDGRELQQRVAWRECFSQALTNAVLQVNREAVTVLHVRATRSGSAS
jgi:UrcA family protein